MRDDKEPYGKLNRDLLQEVEKQDFWPVARVGWGDSITSVYETPLKNVRLSIVNSRFRVKLAVGEAAPIRRIWSLGFLAQPQMISQMEKLQFLVALAAGGAILMVTCDPVAEANFRMAFMRYARQAADKSARFDDSQ